MRKLKFSQILFIVSWLGLVSYVITLMHSWHYADLSPIDLSTTVVSKWFPKVKERELGVIHFLTPKCSCSQQIFTHLLERAPLAFELALVIDDTKDQYSTRLKKKGYLVKSINTKKLDEELASAIKGVPLLVIYDDKKITKYVGGYTDKVITPFTKIDIKQFLNKIKNNRTIASLPVMGCAVSKQYQKLLDPFGLKYQEKI